MTTHLSRIAGLIVLLAASLAFVPAVAAAIAAEDTGTGAVALVAGEVGGPSLESHGMMPGDSVTAAVELHNDGDGELRYSITTAATDGASGVALSSILAVAVTTADTGTGDADPCDDASGTVLRDAQGLADGGQLLGSVTAGADRGDRTLVAGSSEILCITVQLPLAAGNEFQGASSTISLGFVSEATANNP